MDAGTKKLILNLLSSIRSVVPAPGAPEPGNPGKAGDLKSLEYVRDILVLARKHTEELEGFFDPEVLLRYARYVKDYQDIMAKMEQILGELRVYRDAALRFAGGLAEMVEGHLQMTTGHAGDSPCNRCGDAVPLERDDIRLRVV